MKFASALVLVAAVVSGHVQATPTSQVSPGLATCLQSQRTCDVIVVLKSSVDEIIASINSQHFINSAAKTTALVASLKVFTGASQAPILNFLGRYKRQSEVSGFWITNKVSVRGASALLVDQLLDAFGQDIEVIREATVIHIDAVAAVAAPGPQDLEWGVDNVDADKAWEDGVTGQGVVVSSIDTGVRSTHNVLKDNMRATYNWFDVTDAMAQTPVDIMGHGTHTTGTLVGKGGCGVAPDSEWIHCRAFENGTSTEEWLLNCGQWITCPTLADGTGEDCSQKPHVVSNSWGGGQENSFFNDVISAWQAASIIPVFAIGNNGPNCRTVVSPGDQPNVISVGATNAQDDMVTFSSHGPSPLYLRIKPEVSAPGNNIRSASHETDTTFVYQSGTSMACPHVAGAVALLLSKNPSATFQEITDALYQTTYRKADISIICNGGGVNATYPWPNNSYGWGKINAYEALAQLS